MKQLLLLLFSFLPLVLFSQRKHDFNWPLGYGSDSSLHLGGSLVSFSSGGPTVSYFDTEIAYSGDNTNVSDPNGNLVAYSNGCQIQNREHKLMENGDGINPGVVHQMQCTASSGYSFDQGSLFLPMPGSDSLYYLFHLKEEDGGSIARFLLYSVVDASKNAGIGKVILKNEFIQKDTFSGMVSACRHANGRDWWLVIQENNRFVALPPTGKAKYHIYLFNPYGIHYQGEQEVGQLFSYQSWIGQSCFSPNGNSYAIGNIHNGVNFFNFNRCAGILSNPGHLNFSADTVGSMGLAFSPNSRYLYVTTGLWILQFDMAAANVEASKVAVAYYDGFISQLPTTFFHLALAPNGKIYGTASFGTDILHVIHQPDQPGLECEVEQHGLKLSTYHAYTMPNFPHYRLYDLPGSVCDSLGIDAPIVKTEVPETMSLLGMKLQPNPANDLLTIYLAPETSGRIILMNMTGKTMAIQPKAPGNEQITLTTMELPSGVYFVSFRADTGESLTQKVVIQH
jgi:hypothetical protein